MVFVSLCLLGMAVERLTFHSPLQALAKNGDLEQTTNLWTFQVRSASLMVRSLYKSLLYRLIASQHASVVEKGCRHLLRYDGRSVCRRRLVSSRSHV